MINGIHPLRPGANPYVQQGTTNPAAQQPARAATPEPAAAPQQSPIEGLSGDEQEMIQSLFPDNPRTTMRLYGPRGTDREVTARGIGGRLDLKA